ncbi:hypothetical protein SAMN05216436_10819 [bacterium A37T11]|nr:hypothetical protein SAMN05216436_10819 [bacterium A37T11]
MLFEEYNIKIKNIFIFFIHLFKNSFIFVVNLRQNKTSTGIDRKYVL